LEVNQQGAYFTFIPAGNKKNDEYNPGSKMLQEK